MALISRISVVLEIFCLIPSASCRTTTIDPNKLIIDVDEYEDGNVADDKIGLICPSNCSGNGDCVEGNCVCYTGFTSLDCSLSTSNPPSIKNNSNLGVCDTSIGNTCEKIHLVGSGFVNGAQCNVSTYSAVKNGTFHLSRNSTSTCEYVNANEVYASTKDAAETISRRRREVNNVDSEMAHMYGIYVSNDGVHFGDPKYVVVLNRTCQELDFTTSGSSVVKLKPGYCYIAGACYTEGTYRVGSLCDVCVTQGTYDDLFVWTNECVDETSDAV